jgi:HEAT repeat protein
MTGLPTAGAKPISTREQSPAAQAATAWLRSLARATRAMRMYRAENQVVAQLRDELTRSLTAFLEQHGPLDLHFTASEIHLQDEPVVRPSPITSDGLRGAEEKLPFQFYRDGIRRVAILPGVSEREVTTLIEALRITGVGAHAEDDMVTLLWQGNLTKIVVESVPLEQTIYLTARRPQGGGGGGETQAQTYAWSPQGAEIRADIGQATGVQGLHRDTFDDWELPAKSADVAQAWARIEPRAAEARQALAARWEAESSVRWGAHVPGLVRRLLELDPSDPMRAALAHATVTWLASALQHAEWGEVQEALALVRELDPDGILCEEAIRAELAGLDIDDIASRLDDCRNDELMRFTAAVVGIGRPAIELTIAALGRAEQLSVRAAATTALCYLCGSEPELLRPYLADSRWTLVRNVVFILGQIGGPEVVPLLRLVADHPEVRVRRQVVQSLGSAPPETRMPILIRQLSTRDPRLLSATLHMMSREPSPRIARAILERIEAPDFESRSEDNQRALFAALGEMAGDDEVPALEALLHKGGWFARYTLERVATARTLRRIGTEAALAVLEAGLRSRSEVVRAACIDAMSSRIAK